MAMMDKSLESVVSEFMRLGCMAALDFVSDLNLVMAAGFDLRRSCILIGNGYPHTLNNITVAAVGGVSINPCVDLRSCIYGISSEELQWFVDGVKSHPRQLNLVGLHCHLGSSITNVNIFRDAATIMIKVIDEMRAQGLDIKYLFMGGGAKLDDLCIAARLPTAWDLIDTASPGAGP